MVGQKRTKLALTLTAIDPSLGVLVRGSGQAKSAALTALAAVSPEFNVYEDDLCRRVPGEGVFGQLLAERTQLVRHPVPLVDLPGGASEGRVVGSLNLEATFGSGSRVFEPGFIAADDRGIPCIDEVNLRADHLVHLLLGAAAIVVNHVALLAA